MIWVAAHTRGPEDAPLVARRQVNVVTGEAEDSGSGMEEEPAQPIAEGDGEAPLDRSPSDA